MSDVDELIRRRVRESAQATESLLEPDGVAFVSAAAEALVDSLRAQGTAFLCGNGGSAMDATHLAAELLGRFRVERAPLPAVSLADNVSALTAIGNDYGYEHTFSRQLAGLGRTGDVLVAFSTSGNSANVLAAVKTGRERGLATIGMTGAGGGALAELCDLCLRVASTDTARIQEAHMVAGHTICELVERELGVDA
jgi:D-sedoheptulose 7-phosphate isomerase